MIPDELTISVIKVLGAAGVAFGIAMFLTPFLMRYMYTYKLWKNISGKKAMTGGEAVIFNTLHNETKTPRVGGVLIWVSVLAVLFLFWSLDKLLEHTILEKLNFFSRSQTWLLAFTLGTASLLGLADDFLQILTSRKHSLQGGINLVTRLIVVALIALVGALWFYFKLDWRTIYMPGVGNLFIGIWYIPFFIVTMIATFSGSVIDGIDGLAAGVLASAFAAYAGIAFFQNQIDVAAFAAAIVGALLAFLWFNIPPARFWMGETGIIGLTTTLTVIAFFTDSVLILPIIALPLVIASASDIIQITARRVWGKKVFRVAPIQHHFESIGWPSYKVTMRFWVISIACAIIGMAIALVGR
jgi:phospho-N-acetylmuramoyl-pentapeptide-transferase